jgi:hypothetical protein
MRVLRDNQQSLLAVLEAFVYDPLINWRLMQQTDVDHHRHEGVYSIFVPNLRANSSKTSTQTTTVMLSWLELLLILRGPLGNLKQTRILFSMVKSIRSILCITPDTLN